MSESRTYRLIQRSKWLETLPIRGWALLILFSVVFFPMDRFGPGHEQNSLIAVIALIGLFIAAAVIGALMPKAQVDLTLDETGISRRWIRKFPLQLATDDQIKWDEIKAYVIQPEYSYGDVLRITTKGRKHLSLRHDEKILSKDVYRIFIDDFEHRVRMYNAHTSSQAALKKPLIERKGNIYESPTGLVRAVIAALLLLFVPYVLFLPWSAATVGVLGAAVPTVWFIKQVYTSRKNRAARRNI